MKRFVFIFTVLTLGASLLYSQHSPVFSQYMFNHLVINPAYAGSRDALTFSGTSRYQWVGFEGAPNTFTFSAHSPLKDSKSNVGLMAFNDRIAVTSITGVHGYYAFRMQLSEKSRLAFGLQGGLNMRRDKWSTLVRNDMDDTEVDSDSPVILEPRAGFGVYFDTERFYFGVSTPQLLRYPTSTWNAYNGNGINYNSYFASGGGIITLNPYLKIKPSFLVKYINRSPLQIDLNTNLIYKDKFWFGLSYRSQESIVGLFEAQLNEQLRLGYAYDYLLNPLAPFSSGSHEIFIRYELNWGIESTHPRYF